MTDAATGPAPPPGRRRRRLVGVLLVLSLVLNLCFVAGAAWIHLHRHFHHFGPAERFREMAGALHLDAKQSAAFDHYFRTMRAQAALAHENVEPLIDDAWDEAAKPQADETKIMQLFDQAAEKRRSFQHQATTETIAFLALLSPEQRSKFVEIARQHRTAWAKRIKHSVSP